MAGIADVMNLTSQNSFFVYILPWLLTFAIVYGILGHYKVPKSNSARTIIALTIAFFILPIAGPVVVILGQLGMGMLILFSGLLFIMILFEITGTRKITGKVTEQGKLERKKITEHYYKSFGVALAILAVMVFIGAGGLGYLGYSVPGINYPLVFFVGILVLIIWWMVQEGDKQ